METEYEINISRATIGDLDDISSLNEKYMFCGESVRPHFEKVLSDPDNISLKCTVGGDFAGVFIYVKGIALMGDHHELIAQIRRLAAGKSVYSGDTVVVKKEYRGLGLARRLCHAAIKELRERGADLALNEFWVYPDGSVPARNIFGAFDKYLFFGYFENFFRGLHSQGFTCPICGADCACSAMVYLAEVPELGGDGC